MLVQGNVTSCAFKSLFEKLMFYICFIYNIGLTLKELRFFSHLFPYHIDSLSYIHPLRKQKYYPYLYNGDDSLWEGNPVNSTLFQETRPL